jgi:hypothetical protein
MHKTIVHLACEIPQPDFPVHAIYIADLRQRPMCGPCSIGRGNGLVVLHLEAVGQIVGEPALTYAGFATKRTLALVYWTCEGGGGAAGTDSCY